MSIILKNHYEDIKDDGDDVCAYEKEHLMKIKLPASILFQGPSGSGKTNLVLELIRLVGTFERVVLLAKNLEEPLYKRLAEKYAIVEKTRKKRIFIAIDNVAELPPVTAFSPKENNLLIVDDMICESDKDLKTLGHFWTRGRKNKITMCFLSQDYISTPKLIRRNSNYVFVKKINTGRDLKLMLSDFKLDKGIDIVNMYRQAVESPESKMTDFFMIDLKTVDPALRFRHNFDGIEQ